MYIVYTLVHNNKYKRGKIRAHIKLQIEHFWCVCLLRWCNTFVHQQFCYSPGTFTNELYAVSRWLYTHIYNIYRMHFTCYIAVNVLDIKPNGSFKLACACI